MQNSRTHTHTHTCTALIGTYEILPPSFFWVLTSPVVKMRRQFPLSVSRSNLGCELSLPSSGFLLPPVFSSSLHTDGRVKIQRRGGCGSKRW